MAWGVIAPSSYHRGGVNVCLVDGSVHFIPDSIDTGDLTATQGGQNSPNANPGASHYGVWGAMGTPEAGDKSVTDL